MRVAVTEEYAGERAFFAALAIAIVGACWYAAYLAPVAYTHLVAEDRFGEWLTAVAYGWTALLLWFMAWKYGNGLQRFMWIAIGLAAFLLAGEEISWGQRVFRLRTPESMLDLNMQAEMNLHNLATFGSLNLKLHGYAAIVIFSWVGFCGLLRLWSPAAFFRLIDWGIPVFPPRLLPLLVLPPIVWTFFSWPKRDEAGEIMLSLVAFIWAFDLFSRTYPWTGATSARHRALAMLVLLLALACATQVFVWKRGGDLSYRLNNLAAHLYPEHHLYEQAETLFRYIDANPRYSRPDTQLNHARMLMAWGKRQEAALLLADARAKAVSDVSLSPAERAFRTGSVAHILGDNSTANEDFARAIQLVREQIAVVSSPSEDITLLLQEAKFLQASGDRETAKTKQDEAAALAKAHGLKLANFR